MKEILDIASIHNLLVIEDAAEALGSKIGDRKIGTIGDASIFSFFGNKTITTGEGGMILLKDKNIYEKARVLRDHGMSKSKRYWHEYIGFNYRMTNMQAAVGFAQLERFDKIIERKIANGLFYYNRFAKNSNFCVQKIKSHITHSFWLFSMRINSDHTNLTVQDFSEKLLTNGIEIRPLFYPLSSMKIYSKYAKMDCEIAKKISQGGFSLPSSLNLNPTKLENICSEIEKIIDLNIMLHA